MPDFSLDSSNRSVTVATAAAAAATTTTAARNTFNDSSSDEEDPDVIARRVASHRRQQSEFYLNVKQVEEIIQPVWQETPNTPTVAADTDANAATNDVVGGGDMQNAHAKLEWLLRENLRLAKQKSKKTNNSNNNNNAHTRRKAWKRVQYLQTAMDLKIAEVKILRRKMRSQHTAAAAAAAASNQQNTVLVVAAESSQTAVVKNHGITTSKKSIIHEAGNNVVLPAAHVAAAAAVACSGAASYIIGAAASNSGSGTCDMIVENNSFQSAAVSAPVASQPPLPAAAAAAAQLPPPAAATVAAQPAAVAQPAAAAAKPAAAASCPAPVTKAISNQTSVAAAHAKQQPVLSASASTTTTSLLPVQSKQPQQEQHQQQQSSAKSGALKNILQTMSTTTAGTATTTTTNSNNLPLAYMRVWTAPQPAAPPPTNLSSLPPPPPYTKRSIANKSSIINNNMNASAAASATTASAAAPAVPPLPQPPAYTQRSSTVTTTTTASKSHNATTSSTTKQPQSSSSSSLAVAPLTGTANAAVPPEHSRRNSTIRLKGAQSSVVASVTTANGNTLTGTKPVAAAPGGAPSVLVAAVAQLPQPPATAAATTTQHNATTTSAVAKSSANNNALTPAATQTATTGTATIATTTTAPPPLAQNNATGHGTLASPKSSTKSVVQEAGGRTAPPLPLPEKPQQEAQSVAGTSTRAAKATPAPVRRNSSTAATMTTKPHNSTSAQSSSLLPSQQSSNGNATTMPSASSTPNPSTATPAATNFASANSTSQLTPPPEISWYDSSWPRDMMSPVWKRVDVNVEGYSLSQNEWVDFVRHSVLGAPAHLKGALRTLAAHDNVPRRQPQFGNHVHKLLRLHGPRGIATADRLWIFLKEKFEKNTVTALSQQKERHTASQGGGLDKSPSVPQNEHHHSEAEQSQESCRRLALSIGSAPSYLRSHLQAIVALRVVPRTKEELLDVAKKTLNLRAKALDEVWNYLVKHVHSGERPPQHSKTAVSVQPTAARDTRAMSSNNSGANTTTAHPLSFRGHLSGSSVGTNVTAASAIARGYPFSSMSDRVFEPATRTVSGIGSAAPAAADQARIRDAQVSLMAAGATTARTSSISRAPNGAEKTSATTNETAPAQAIRPGNALNTASGNSNNCTTATQNTASLNRRQGTTTGVSAASSVAAAQPHPLENRITSTLAGSQKRRITMKIEADDQKQPFSGFNPQFHTTARGEDRVTFLHEHNAAAIPSATLCERMKEWDPFWDPTFVLVTDITGQVESPKGTTWARTAAYVTVDLDKIRQENGLKFSQEAKCDWGERKTTGGLKEGESRLLLKMIPLHPPSGKKAKADGHLWPKGTFLQITTGGAISRIRIQQRKQQQHNEKLWKDMSNYLDLTEHLSSNSLHQPFKIEMICHDEEPYFMCIAFCRYRSADAIFKMLTTPTSIAPIRRVFESKEEARRKIVDLASSQMIVLDDDDGSSEKEETAGVFSFSLVDSYSKKLIKTPVRGSRCAHFQCFDLEQFIVGNAMVSGNRWRCLVCENFIPISDLELCGLTHSILKEYAGQASSTLNRIEFRSNGTHQLLNESNNRKRATAPNPQESSNVGDPKRARAADVEVIELY